MVRQRLDKAYHVDSISTASTKYGLMGISLTVEQPTLTRLVEVRILDPQPINLTDCVYRHTIDHEQENTHHGTAWVW